MQCRGSGLVLSVSKLGLRYFLDALRASYLSVLTL